MPKKITSNEDFAVIIYRFPDAILW